MENKEMNTAEDRVSRIFKNPICIILLALMCCALWGSATPFIKLGYQFLMPEKDVPSTLLFAGIRFFLAGVITVVIYSIARRRLLYPKAKNLGRVAVVSCFQTVIQYIFFYLGLAITTGVKGTIASGSATFFAILVSTLVFRQEKLNVKKILACVLGFAGIITVNIAGLMGDMSLGFNANLGDLFVIISAISCGISSVLTKKFSTSEDPVVISGYQFIMGGAVLALSGLCLGGSLDFGNINGILVLVYLAFLSAVAYSVWGVLLKYNHVSRVTVFSFTTPVFGVLLTELILNEESTVEPVSLILALVLVCLGVLILNVDFEKLFKKENPTLCSDASATVEVDEAGCYGSDNCECAAAEGEAQGGEDAEGFSE